MREINVSRAGDPVHAGDKALTRETPEQRGRINRYAPRKLLMLTLTVNNRQMDRKDKIKHWLFQILWLWE